MVAITRRHALAGAATTLALPAASIAQIAPAKALADLAAIAAGKPPVLWSESSDLTQVQPVITAFAKAFPQIKVEYIRDTGGNTLASKAIQETQAGGVPAALLVGDPAQFAALDQRAMLVRPDWKSLGVEAGMIGAPFMVATTAAIGCFIWNTQKVSAADAPKHFDDFLKPRFANKVGSWIRAPGYASLGKLMGEAYVRGWVEKLVANGVRVYDTTYKLAQEVGSGEIEVAIGLTHSVAPVIAAGAPVAFALTEPVSANTLFSAVVAKAANPEGAQVLAAWLTTREGADAYESGVGRGNPLVKGSKAATLVGDRKISEYPMEELPTFTRLMTDLNRMLSARGAGQQR